MPIFSFLAKVLDAAKSDHAWPWSYGLYLGQGARDPQSDSEWMLGRQVPGGFCQIPIIAGYRQHGIYNFHIRNQL